MKKTCAHLSQKEKKGKELQRLMWEAFGPAGVVIGASTCAVLVMLYVLKR